jgi:predicted ATP-binding protein involved in virulence
MTRQYKESGKAIKPLIQSAEKGILEAQFQLHEYYDKGKYVEKDGEIAQQYLELLESSLVDKHLILSSLTLSEFRRCRALNITFDKKITVIVGDNGAGKTSITEAISKILSWLNNNLEKDGVNGKQITVPDINVNAVDYAEITGRFELGKSNKFEASLARVVPGFAGSQSSDVNVIKQFGAMYRKAAKNTAIMIPLLAFYSVERSNFILANNVPEKASGEITINRLSALKDALEGSGKLENFPEFYIELVNLADGENTKEIKDLRSHILALEKSIYDVYAGRQPPADDPFLAVLNAKKEELKKLLHSMSSANYQRHLDFVNFAIETLVPDVKNLEVDRSSGKPQLLVENFGNKVNISQLSQGQKMLVALTGDLARRLVTLNPESDNPLHCHGIVIIDEIELHLHPKWQQVILVGLQRTFPNLQFIVTTHSPQVLSTVRRENIRTLGLDASGQVVVGQPLARTYGEPSGDVLHSVMLVDPLPPIAEKADLQRLTELVDQGLHEKLEAMQLMQKLLAVLGEQHPQLLRLQRSIHRQKALKG